MARKSKGFRELLKQKQSEKTQQQKAMQRLSKRIMQGSLGEKFERIEYNPKNEVKMSEVLEAFVEPYLESTRNATDMKTLFYMAVMAWNLALVSESDRTNTMNDLFKTVFDRDDDREIEHEVQEIINELIDRQLTFFTDYDRFIMDFELVDTGNTYHLSVVSSLSKEASTQDAEDPEDPTEAEMTDQP